MQNSSKQIQLIKSVVDQAKAAKVAHLSTEDADFNGRELILDGKRLLNFASCNYLGLALDKRVSDGAIDAIRHYGNSFPTSRSFITMGILESLEAELEKLFGYPTLLTTSTSLGHIAWLPLLVQKQDAVILDHQVHHSVTTAAQLVRTKGVNLELLRHSRMDRLEKRIVELSEEHDAIWYLADGVYSMFGDLAPMAELLDLLNRYPKFHVYIDDAHGMSWTGDRGSGYVLREGALHPRMKLITSLGKSFGSLGGAMVFQNEEEKQFVKECGGPLIFSSPMTPGAIGAALASAKIHLSDELPELQNDLQERMNFFCECAVANDIPLIGNGETPIFFIPVGTPEIAFAIGQKMMRHGFYQSLSAFPSVPIIKSGLRYTLTNWIEKKDIEQMMEILATERKATLEEMNYTEEKIRKAFR